jgi:hypothetical protein
MALTHGFLNRCSRPRVPKIARRDAHLVASTQPRNTLTSHDARAAVS